MNQTLQELCDLQIKNEAIVRKASLLQDDEQIKIGALFYTTKNQQADEEQIRRCKDILKSKTGVFSNFRGMLGFAIRAKISVAADPEKYLDRIIEIYNKLKEGRKLPGEILVMTAITICDQANGKDVDAVIAEVKETYARIKARHKFMTSENDMTFIALMVLSGKDVDQTVEEEETIYLALKDRFRIPSDTAQAVALILAMSEKPVDEKVDEFLALYEDLKAVKHATSKQRAMSVYAAFADLDIPKDMLVKDISAVEDFLRRQKGYGIISSSDVRRVMSATLVLQNYGTQSTSYAASAVSSVIAEEVILTIIMIIVITTSVNFVVINS